MHHHATRLNTVSPSRTLRFPRGPANGRSRRILVDAQRQQPSWTSAIPLLVLVGADDVLNPAAPCKYFLDGAAAHGAKTEMQIYPGAYHHFDWPNLPRHELPNLRNAAGAVPIYGTDPAARQDASLASPVFSDGT
jgi:dienelactone hydrolase